MKRLFTSSDHILVSQLKNILEREGIACVVKNEILSGLSPEVPFTETFPELWIQQDTDYEKAEEIKKDWKAPVAICGPSWQCPNCGERLEAQFSSCWKCGTNRLQDTAVA
jgi:hypothetical protein